MRTIREGVRLSECCELLADTPSCTVLKVKDRQFENLIVSNKHTGLETHFRVYRDLERRILTVWRSDGKISEYDWEVSLNGNTYLTDRPSEKGKQLPRGTKNLVEEVLEAIDNLRAR